ncbi:MAG TPA: hypothetical protein VHE80_04635, partial [Acidimicrobiales bacterium]|nr:hypothetical protein [Acidimicrobiales bacterium]
MARWEVIDHAGHGTEVLAVHAALLGNGRVVVFSGSEHNREQHNAGRFDHSRIWDPATRRVSHIRSPAYDLFCCGHAFLADGRLLVAGGTNAYDPGFLGSKEVAIFDPASVDAHADPWHRIGAMAGGRWYPTLVTLPDGRVVTVSGLLDAPFPAPVNTAVEVFSPEPAPGWWRVAGYQPDMPGGYPRMHLVPDGRVLCATPMAGVTRAWDPVGEGWADVAPGAGPDYTGYNTTSVLLPLMPQDGYRARVLLAGAPEPLVLDLGAPEHGWRPTAPRPLHGSPRRNHACAVLLPDATVLVVGGSVTEQDADAVLTAESFDPATGSWSNREAATVPRVYHNVALLLQDGTVWTAGSNHNGAMGHSEHRMELYHPPYLDHPG